MNKSLSHRSFYILLALGLLFIAGRYLGQYLSDNAWSFVHWQFLPVWYGPVWVAALVLVGFLFCRPALLDRFASAKWSGPVFFLALAVILWFMQFDSFLYGGGNLRVAQVGLADRIFLRWFELGTLLLLKFVFWLYSALNFESLAGATAAWKTTAFLSSILCAIAAWLIASLLSREKLQRFFLFLIIFFGPQAILQFGYVGVEPLIAASILWILYCAIRLALHWTGKNLLLLWGLLALGIFLNISLIFLLPAIAFLTLSGSPKGLQRLVPGLVGAGLALAIIVIAVYFQGGRSLEFSTWILFVAGKPPHSDYGLFSLLHLGDILQIIFLAAPLIVLAMYLRVVGQFDPKSRLMVFTACFSQIGGLVALLLLDPWNSTPLDFPRLVVFLTPISVLLAIVLSRAGEADTFKSRVVPIAAAFSLLLPFATLPIYTRIDQAGTYMTAYLEKHEYWYRRSCLTFRDAYFGRKALGQAEIDKANRWETMLPERSVDFLNFRGSVYLSTQNDAEEALRQLSFLIVKDPYWVEPREAVANIQIQASRFDRAKPQIDTCLLLEPYNPEHHLTLYSYYRNQKNAVMAAQTIEIAQELFPKNVEVGTDYMIYKYEAGKVKDAIELADGLLARDRSLPYPYLIKGFAEDKAGDIPSALNDYRAFLAKQKDQPETLMVQKRLEELNGAGQKK